MSSFQIHLGFGTHEFAQYRLQARRDASVWAQKTLAIPPEKWCILNTKTTGRDQDAKITQVGLINGAGHVLINNIVCKPFLHIPPERIATYYVTAETIRDTPSFSEIYKDLLEITGQRVVVIYNKGYSLRMMRQSLMGYGVPLPFSPPRVECAMMRCADYVGEWDDKYQNFKSPKLIDEDRSAIEGCAATLEAIRKMAKGNNL